ncbi:MAG: glutamate synthase subunit beta [Clostridiaceae bacterium]|nr:glutamate synthase subunit beta [Clostridiaceae bacterium]
MGRPTGFIEYQRALPPDRPPLERIHDWQEFHTEWPAEKQQIQGARCMNCGVPFCHSGILIHGAAAGCPIHNLIPEWNDLIYRGQWRQAWQRLAKTNNFPEFTGRVCPAPCEGACTVGIHDPQVTIKTNECAIIDRAFHEGWIRPQPPCLRSGKRVAVVGSGPSGLACADQLNKAGHWVTVFERADRAGGLLMYGIPNMKLSKDRVQRRIDLLAAEGISFITRCEIGKDILLSQLQKDFDAVVLCGGATKPRDLKVPGRNLHGVHFAVDFLRANTRSLLDSGHQDGAYTDACGLDVLVIGGGDTGTDCVGTAIRQGCRSVTQFEIMPRPAQSRTPQNPWPQWPAVLRTDYGHEEAIALTGADPRIYLTTAKKLTGDESGQVQAVHTVSVQWIKDADGKIIPVEQPGSERVWPAQLVLLAMGFLGPEDAALQELAIERDQRSNVRTMPGAYATSRPGIFTAGDMHRGQSLVVWAIHEGRGAARACDQYLMGASRLP